MARLMAAGEPATSEVEKIEQARADAAGAVRALEALNLAIAGAEGSSTASSSNIAARG